MTKFLRSDANPEGYRLEDILRLVRNDMLTRATKIMADGRPEAEHVMANNMKILGMITECIHIAEDSTKVLNKAFGPSGKIPRIGGE